MSEHKTSQAQVLLTVSELKNLDSNEYLDHRMRISNKLSMDESNLDILMGAVVAMRVTPELRRRELNKKFPFLSNFLDVDFFITCADFREINALDQLLRQFENGHTIHISIEMYLEFGSKIHQRCRPDQDKTICRLGSAVIGVELQTGQVTYSYPLNQSRATLPYNVTQLMTQYAILNSSKLNWNGCFSATDFVLDASENTKLATFFNVEAGEDVEIVFTTRASNIVRNDKNLDIVCIQDDRNYEVCSEALHASNVIRFTDLLAL
ncbi:hypothetical protein [Vibrio tapetis]|uniref:Uncharacterized protein n=1 Tax=Vibrio tapetis subsp. tapetis TaxID=1671868 RepID=A0A2N8ZAX2_9VIBR|nr:hypothetical protein [Vibrio tapetis]SON49042.1 protein of unknown function [Vibrio tapetis subsp. tapetis]